MTDTKTEAMDELDRLFMRLGSLVNPQKQVELREVVEEMYRSRANPTKPAVGDVESLAKVLGLRFSGKFWNWEDLAEVAISHVGGELARVREELAEERAGRALAAKDWLEEKRRAGNAESELALARELLEASRRETKTERAMKTGCQKHLLDIANALGPNDGSEDEDSDNSTSARVVRFLGALRKRIVEFEEASGEVQGIDEENHHLRLRVKELEATLEAAQRDTKETEAAHLQDLGYRLLAQEAQDKVRDLTKQLAEARQAEAKACVLGRYCSRHNFIHGAEAEELRDGIEKLIEDSEFPTGLLQKLLDRVDARDCLAYLETRDGDNATHPQPAKAEPALPKFGDPVEIWMQGWRATKVDGCNPSLRECSTEMGPTIRMNGENKYWRRAQPAASQPQPPFGNPLPPDVLVGALQDRLHYDAGRGRAAKSVKVRLPEDKPAPAAEQAPAEPPAPKLSNLEEELRINRPQWAGDWQRLRRAVRADFADELADKEKRIEELQAQLAEATKPLEPLSEAEMAAVVDEWACTPGDKLVLAQMVAEAQRRNGSRG